MADKTIPSNGKELLLNSGVNSLPNNPSQIGFNAREIKAAMNRQAAIIYDWLDEIDTIQADSDATLVVHKTGAETISGAKTFTGGVIFSNSNVQFGSNGSDNSKQLDIYYTTNLRGPVISNIIVPGNTGFSIGTSDTRWHTGYFVNLNLSGKFVKGSYEFDLPSESGTLATTSMITKSALQTTLGEASVSEKGLMSASDKANLNAVVDLVGQVSGDTDSVVNTLREVLSVFNQYPEGTSVATALAGKLNVSDLATTDMIEALFA